MEVGERLTVIQQHKKEDVVGNEMVDQPPLMEPEERKGEEIEQAASESRHLADELEGMVDPLEIEEKRGVAVNVVVPGEQEEVEGDDDDGREGAGSAEKIVENPLFDGLDEEGSKGFLIKKEAEGQEANKEAEELKESEEEERTRKGHEAEQRGEEGAERPARKTEVSCVGIRHTRPSVIVSTRSRQLAIEDGTNNKDAAVEPSDADVSPAVLEKSEKERMDRAGRLEEKVDDSPEGNLDAKREENLDGRLEDKSDDNLGRDDRQSQDGEEILKMQLKMEEMRRRMKEMEEMLRDRYKEKETTANGHVRGIKEEIITLDED